MLETKSPKQDGGSRAVKHWILILLGVSYYILFTLLLVILRPSDGASFLLMLLFAFLLVGVEFFFTIPKQADDGEEPQPAPINRREFFIFGMFIPFWVFMAGSGLDISGLHRELALTALALFVAAVYRALLGAVDRAVMSRK